MNIKFISSFVLIVLFFICIEGAKIKEKPSSDDKENEEVMVGENITEDRPLFINQFTQALKFLGSFFNMLQKQLTTTITNFNPLRPNPVFSALLANPNLIPFALKRLREPINEMVTIVDKLQKLMANNESTAQLENNTELQRLLEQLQRRLQTLFGPLMGPNSGLTGRIPANLPAALEMFSNFANQFAAVLAVFSQTVRDVTTNNQGMNPLSLSNRSEAVHETNLICDKLKSITSNMEERQGLLPGALWITNFLIGYLLYTLFGSASAGAPAGTFPSNQPFLIPLTNRTVEDFQHLTFGLVDEKTNKLIIANVMTKDIDHSLRDSVAGNGPELKATLGLSSLHSLMTSLVQDLRGINEPKIMSSLKCQLEGFGCTIRNREKYSEVETCLKTLSTCIGSQL